MALTDSTSGGMYMPVAPAYGNGGMNGFGGDWAWIILLLLLGWGNNGWGGSGGGMGGMYPWLNNSNQINDGFRDQMLNTTINGIQNGVISGFGDVQNSLCAGFAGVTAAVNGAQNATAQQLYTNQIADLERSFAAQTANTAALNALQAQFSQCCCDNRAGIENLRYTVATEACADRSAVSDALRDVLAANTASTQRILDQMCQDKIDAKNETIAELRTQLNMANLAASQGAQTARVLADNAAQTAALEQYLAPVPRPAYVVQNPNCCTNTCGVNCGCGIG